MLRLVAAVLSVALLTLAVPAARAESWSAKDRRADVRATPIRVDLPARADVLSRADECEGPRGHRARSDKRRDILGLSVDHAPDAVVLSLAMRDLTRRHAGTSYSFHARTAKDAWFVDVSWFEPGGDLELFFAKEPDYPAPSEIEDCTFVLVSTGLQCEGLAGEADAQLDQLTVTIPRRCLRSPDWMRVGAQVHGFRRSNAPGRFTVFTDVWARPGERLEGFLPPFGPRVRVG